MTLTDAEIDALQAWVRRTGIGSAVSDVEPLTGGSQNVVVRLDLDGRDVVTMRREIAVLQTLRGTDVPHPEFIAGCEDLDVLGVVFYLMQAVDGFNPGTETDEADHCVTVRERDSMEQVRIPISEVKAYISERIKF